ncbi:SCO-spondin, partial [Araneus ventricosus]
WEEKDFKFPKVLEEILAEEARLRQRTADQVAVSNGPYAPFGFESIEKQLWRNKQNDRPISDSEIKAVLSQLFKTDQWLPPAGHMSEDVTSHA